MPPRLSCLAVLLLLARSAVAAPVPPELTWFDVDLAPLLIVSGERASMGAADRWGRDLKTLLTDFTHSRRVGNVARLLEEAKQRDNICSQVMIRSPEREQILVFSAPIVWIMPNGVSFLRERDAAIEPFLNAQGELRLEQFLARPGVRVAAAKGRAYGGRIDTALVAGEEAGAVKRFSNSDLFASGLLQVQNGADGVVGYAIELKWAAQRLKIDPERFHFVPVEGETALIPMHVACSRGPLGERVINRVNELIAAGQITELATAAYREWLPPDVARHYDRQRHQQAAASSKH